MDEFFDRIDESSIVIEHEEELVNINGDIFHFCNIFPAMNVGFQVEQSNEISLTKIKLITTMG